MTRDYDEEIKLFIDWLATIVHSYVYNLIILISQDQMGFNKSTKQILIDMVELKIL